MPRRPYTPTRNAFTLIELLVVITIIVIVLALLTPSLDTAMALAERARCAATKRMLGVGNAMYATDFKGWYVPIKDAGSVQVIQAGQTIGYQESWTTNRHYKNLVGISVDRPGWEAVWPKSFDCPSAIAGRTGGLYMWRAGGFNWTGTGTTWADFIAIKRSRIERPSDIVQMADACAWQWGSADAANPGGSTGWDVYGDAEPSSTPRIAYRHAEGANAQLFDGSVQYYRKGAMFFFLPNGTTPDTVRNDRMWKIYP